MRLVALGELCDVKGGKRLPKGASYAKSKTEHPYLRVCDFVDGSIADGDLRYISEETHKKIRRYTISDDDVYISIAGTIGLVGLVPKHLSGANLTENAARLDIHYSSVLDKRYLARYLSTEGQAEISNRKKATSQPKLALFRIAEIPIPLPPLAEQKRIAGILDAADALRAKRRESLAQLDTLLQATFLDMFGDPVTNPMGWERRILGEITSIEAPMVDPREEEYRQLLHYGPDRIEKDTGELLPAKTAEEDELISGKFLCSPGEILYSKIRPYLNKVALALEKCLCSADVYPVRPNREALTKEFLVMLLRSTAFLDYVAGFSRRANIPKLNRKQFAGYKAPVPPLDLQRRFTTIVESVEAQKARMRAHLAELDALFASLQSRAFNGEL